MLDVFVPLPGSHPWPILTYFQTEISKSYYFWLIVLYFWACFAFRFCAVILWCCLLVVSQDFCSFAFHFVIAMMISFSFIMFMLLSLLYAVIMEIFTWKKLVYSINITWKPSNIISTSLENLVCSINIT